MKKGYTVIVIDNETGEQMPAVESDVVILATVGVNEQDKSRLDVQGHMWRRGHKITPMDVRSAATRLPDLVEQFVREGEGSVQKKVVEPNERGGKVQ